MRIHTHTFIRTLLALALVLLLTCGLLLPAAAAEEEKTKDGWIRVPVSTEGLSAGD